MNQEEVNDIFLNNYINLMMSKPLQLTNGKIIADCKPGEETVLTAKVDTTVIIK